MKSLALLFLVVANVTAFHLKMGLSVGQTFPAAALKKWGVSGKPAVVYFYGADGSPSCTKECQAFGSTYEDFKALGCTVLGVRNEKGVKSSFEGNYPQNFVVDTGDEVRNTIGIKKDLFGALGGRETYVIDGKGVVTFVFNDQFKAEAHAANALEAAKALKPVAKKGGFSFPF